MPPNPPLAQIPFFDSHLDLAYLAVNKRDMLATLPELEKSAANLPHPPAAVTLPSLAPHANTFGGVRLALGTIFTEPVASAALAIAPEKYPSHDADAAHRAGRAQLEAYLTWRDQGHINLSLRDLLRSDSGTGDIRGGMGVAEPVPPSPERLLARLGNRRPGPHVASASSGQATQSSEPQPLTVGILIENADPIRSPDELEWWRERGVVAIGMAWIHQSRYAGGNATSHGLSDLGRDLVRRMDALRIVHDASHLSDRAFSELIECARGPVMASHSNCRALLADPSEQRHLSDAQIRAIVERPAPANQVPGGIIGLNLFSRFLDTTAHDSGRASIESCVRHVEHVCEISGDLLHVGLGSDMDGGFPSSRLPAAIDRPEHLPRLLDALINRGWTDADLRSFAFGNWTRFFNQAL